MLETGLRSHKCMRPERVSLTQEEKGLRLTGYGRAVEPLGRSLCWASAPAAWKAVLPGHHPDFHKTANYAEFRDY
jgi:hypothetical protein